jgi:phage baseplate assembly protein V
MINILQNQMRMQSGYTVNQQATPQLGTISTFDPNYYTAKVLLQPGDVLTNDIPVLTAVAGNGWGIFIPPVPGQMCVVIFQGGDPNNGVVVGLGFNDTNRPLPTPAGEIWLVHESGASIKLTNDGKIIINNTAAIEVGDQGQALKKLLTEAFVELYNNHTHGASPPPDSPITNAHLTTVLKAN